MEVETVDKRRLEMRHALRVSALLFLGFLFITQQVLARGWLYELDHYILHLKNFLEKNKPIFVSNPAIP